MDRTKRLFAGVALAVVSVTTAACGLNTSPKPSTNADGKLNLCSLLTIQQASTILGTNSQPGRPSAQNTQCYWNGRSAIPFIVIELMSPAQYDGAKKTVGSGVVETSVDDLGDEAFVKVADITKILYFRKGNSHFSVVVTKGLGQPDDLDAEKNVATIILQSLKTP
jgi:hypothetical protein